MSDRVWPSSLGPVPEGDRAWLSRLGPVPLPADGGIRVCRRQGDMVQLGVLISGAAPERGMTGNWVQWDDRYRPTNEQTAPLRLDLDHHPTFGYALAVWNQGTAGADLSAEAEFFEVRDRWLNRQTTIDDRLWLARRLRVRR